MTALIYLLCAAASLFTTVLLLRHWRRTRLGLLFWSGICFLTLTLANALLFVDRILVQNLNLTIYRNSITLLAVVFMLFGLIMGRRER